VPPVGPVVETVIAENPSVPAGPVGPVGPITVSSTVFQVVPDHSQVRSPTENNSFTDGESGKFIDIVFSPDLFFYN
jgi:hypothetical protein